MHRELKESWRACWSERRFRRVTYSSLASFLIALAFARRTLAFVETRSGVELADPLFAALPAVDLSGWTFALIYGATLLAISHLARRPRRLVIALQAYSLLLCLRMSTLWLVPLEAPSTMIALRDPVVETFAGSDRPLRNDLFFSGHTSTAFLFFLAAARGRVKWALLAATFAMGIFLILQHVHYTVDVVAAPFFAFGCYRLVRAAPWADGGEAEGI